MVEAVGSAVHSVREGDLVIAPFAWLTLKSAFFTRPITVPRMPKSGVEQAVAEGSPAR